MHQNYCLKITMVYLNLINIIIEIGYCRMKRHEFEDTAIETMENKAQLEMKD